MKLTQPNIARLRLPAGRSDAIFFDDDLPGFGLRLRSGGKRTWIVQYRIGSKQRRLTLGNVEKLRAEKAREEARNRLARVELGADPQQEKVAVRAAAHHTVGRLVDDYLARRHYETGADPLRRRSFELTELYLTKHWKPLHGSQVNKVDRFAVASRLSAIEADVSSTTAARARVALSTMFAWAIGQGIVDSNPVIGTNKPPEPEARDRVLTNAEIAEIWHACRDDSFGRVVKLLLLTGQRRSEVSGILWSEIDFDKSLWTIPPERTKNGREHIVPLAPMVVTILQVAPRLHRPNGATDSVLGEGMGGFSGWSKAKAALDKRLPKMPR